MTDDNLDFHAEMFLTFEVRPMLNITFQQFLTQPDFYIDRAIEMIYGDGLNIQGGMTVAVSPTWH